MIDKKTKQINKNGFTMIELLIVIVILGILSAIGLGAFTSSQQKARDARRKSDLKSIGTSLETYYNDHGAYPLDGTGSGFIYGCGTDGEEICNVDGQWSDAAGTVYMVQLPGDPSGGLYHYVSDGASYRIYARLENDRDRDVPDINDAPAYYSQHTGSNDCQTGNCNYGRASSNVTLGTTTAEL